MELITSGFIGIKEARVNGEGVHLITAPIGEGKTSLKESIIWLLTGYARGISGKDQARLINDGSKEMEVSLSIGNATLTRKRTGTALSAADLKVIVGGKPQDMSEAESLKLIGIPDPQAVAVYDEEGRAATVEYITRLLYKCLGSRIDMRAVMKSEGIDVDDPDAAPLLKDLGPGNIDIRQRLAVEKGQEAKRQMKEYLDIDELPDKVVLKKGEKNVEVVLSTVPVAAAEERYKTLNCKRDRLLQMMDKTGGVSDRGALEPGLKELNERYQALVQFKSNREFLAQETMMLQLMEKADCPVYEMKCPSKSEKITKIIEEKRSYIEKLTASLEGCPENLDEAIQACQREIDTADMALKVLKDAPGDIKGELEEVEAALAFGKEVLEKVRERHSRNMDCARLASLAEKASKRSDLFDRIEKALAPGGIMVKALKEPLERVLLRFAENCRMMGLNADTKGWISVNGRPLSLCSDGQRLIAWFSLQEAVAKEAGLPLLICDRLEMLDPVTKAMFLRFSLQRASEYRAIFLFAVPSIARDEKGVYVMKPGRIPGIASWWIENGVLEPVHAHEELKEAA